MGLRIGWSSRGVGEDRATQCGRVDPAQPAQRAATQAAPMDLIPALARIASIRRPIPGWGRAFGLRGVVAGTAAFEDLLDPGCGDTELLADSPVAHALIDHLLDRASARFAQPRLEFGDLVQCSAQCPGPTGWHRVGGKADCGLERMGRRVHRLSVTGRVDSVKGTLYIEDAKLPERRSLR